MTTEEDYWLMCKNNKFITVGDDVDYNISVLPTDETIILCFQCTKGVLGSVDWKCNFNFPSTVYKNQASCMRIHRGYVKAWKSARDTIMEQMKVLINKYPLYDVVVIGHSLGGAMALLAGEDIAHYLITVLRHVFPLKPDVVTFGAPKICANKATVQYINDMCDVTQYVNVSDPVPYVVPTYRHVNKVKLGKFSMKELFNPEHSHMCYGDLL